MKNPSNRQPGVTLLEVTIVIFLISLIVGISMPRFSTLFESNLTKEAKRVALLLKNLRTEAILHGQNFRIVFRPKKNDYQIMVEDTEIKGKYLPHPKYGDPIAIPSSIKIFSIRKDKEEQLGNKFDFDKIEFEKIFGQEFTVRIDSSGLTDLFTVKLADDEMITSVSVVNIMGKVVIAKEEPLL